MRSPKLTRPYDETGINLKAIREELGLSQAQLAALAGFSKRAIQSCEQGWRHAGTRLEKTVLLLLMSHRNPEGIHAEPCWEVMDCPSERCDRCITYRSRQGHLCWYLSGTLCSTGGPEWDSKRAVCIHCRIFRRLMREPDEEEKAHVPLC